MKRAFAFWLLLAVPASAQADQSRARCSLIGTYISCDDGTDYTVHGTGVWGPDGEHYTLSKNSGGLDRDPASIDGDYTTQDGTKIRVSGGMATVEYSDRVLEDRREEARRREERKKAFEKALGKDDPARVDADGFYE